MTVHYIRLVVNSSFPALYYVLARKFGKCYRRCLKLESGRLYGKFKVDILEPSFCIFTRNALHFNDFSIIFLVYSVKKYKCPLKIDNMKLCLFYIIFLLLRMFSSSFKEFREADRDENRYNDYLERLLRDIRSCATCLQRMDEDGS